MSVFEGRYVDLRGHPTWIVEGGEGATTVLLLHGGLLHTDLLTDSLGVLLAGEYRVAGFDRIGHGYTADNGKAFSYEAMADETIAFLEHARNRPVVLVGWSDGGVAALMAALKRPDLVDALVTIGSKYHVSGSDTGGFTPETSAYKWCKSEYAARSPDGEAHFDDVAQRLVALWQSGPLLTQDDLGRLSMPCLVMAGDRDVATLEHEIEMYRGIPKADLAIVPDAQHGLPFEKPQIVADLIRDFIKRL